MQIFLIHNYNSINTNTHLSYNRLENLLSLMDSTIKLRYLEKEESYISWKYEAYKSIKNSHVILFISNQEVTSKNMEWELKLAYKLEKPILNINFETLNQNIDIYEYIYSRGLTETITHNQLNKLVEHFKIIDKRVPLVNDFKDIQVDDLFIQLNNSSEINLSKRRFEHVDSYTKKKIPVDISIELYELLNQLKKIEFKGINLSLNESGQIDMTSLLEQYRIFVQSSESLMQRRQSINNFYITANTLMISLFIGLSARSEFDTYILYLTGCILSILGIVNSIAWRTILQSFGKLNSSKIKVISAIEKHLPVSLYDMEWKAISYDLKNGTYKSFTKSESHTASTFLILYTLALVILSILLLKYILSGLS